ncbi:MAG: DNA circularization N-terminal domain-containing protein [Proteobacteria bacterium]|nr:DNA circularization N-terminal domain-containing protein [Pseudomonadota bacterium]
MGWRDELRPGSFRGVDFFIEKSDLATGRRSVLHEFPNRETAYTEDLGKINNGYEITGHVLGDNYFDAKRKLQDVFTRKGPGELIHPYYGSKFVQIGPVQISESSLEGAIAVFTAKFFDAGDNRFPKGTNDKGAILTGAVDTAIAESKKDFDDNFSIVGLPGHAIESARVLVSLASDAFNDATKTFADVSDAVADLAFATRNLVAETNDLLQAPSVLSQRLLDSFALLEEVFESADDKTNSLSTFFDFGADETEVTGDTPIRIKEKENQDKFINFIRRAASVKSASTASITDFPSFDDALNKRIEITNVIELQIREDDDTDLYQSLVDVNAALVDAVPDVDAQLPNIQEVEVKDTGVSLLIAYDLFESPDNEDDIINRNGIRHPGFVEAGSIIEVLDVI